VRPARRMHESAGLRVVFCTRSDCAHAGEPVEVAMSDRLSATGFPGAWVWCLADNLIMDRRLTFGLPCVAFARRAAERLPGSG
jgi:hypothetical protein